jgi:hypothetical protein
MNGTTFANSSLVGCDPLAIFITKDNTIYVPDRTNQRIPIWIGGESGPVKMLPYDFSLSFSLFVTDEGDIYVDNGFKGQVDKWIAQSTSWKDVMRVESPCGGLFVDIVNNLYCSLTAQHRILRMSLNDDTATPIVIAGTGSAGDKSDMLSYPYGIFVDTNLDLYVADSLNDRIQLFRNGQSTAITVAGRGAAINVDIDEPTGIVVGFCKYLFIVAHKRDQILEWGPNSIRCLVGCSQGAGSQPNPLHHPFTVAFDTYGNMFVSDQANNRIQKFSVISDACSKL